MAGYAARTHPSEGVVSDLYAKVLALVDSNGQRAVWITTDLIGLRASVTEPICERIMQRTGLARHQLLINSSHTHTGPAIAESDVTSYGLSAESIARMRAYRELLQERIVSAVEQALKRLEPVELSYGSGAVSFVMSRREPTRDRGVILGVNPRGAADRTVPLLRIAAADGTTRAVVFGAATHNTTLTQDEYRITGDYAGFAQEFVQKQLPGVQAMFVLGFAGDSNPYPRGTLELARQHGETLGREVLRVLDRSSGRCSAPSTCSSTTPTFRSRRLQPAPSSKDDRSRHAELAVVDGDADAAGARQRTETADALPRADSGLAVRHRPDPRRPVGGSRG